MVIVLLV